MSERLVLASASPRRAEILVQLGLLPEIRPANVDESYLPQETPAEHVERLARAKAESIAAEVDDALVIGGDTVVLEAGRVLGKPLDVEEATDMIMGLSGKAHEVLSGLALAGSHGVVSGVASTTVRFRDYDLEAARRYAETGEPLDKAGSYGIQGRGAALVRGIEGDYYSVVGLPVGLLVELLERAGWRYDFGGLSALQSRDRP